MFTFRHLAASALLLPLVALAGCTLFSGSAWQGPSPLSGPPPPPPERQEKHETQGGFTVLVDAPGYPAAARVVTDIGEFAQRRGFVRQSAKQTPQFDPVTHQPLPPTRERYLLGSLALDVTDQPDLRVLASLHSARLSRKFVDQFYHDFDQEYAGRYGDEDPIFENDFGDDTGSPPRGGSGRAGGGRGGGRGSN